MRREIDKFNRDFEIRAIKYYFFAILGMNDTGHYRAVESARDGLRNRLEDYNAQCKGKSDDDDDWKGGAEAEDNIADFTRVPPPVMEGTHGAPRGRRSVDGAPALPPLLPAPGALPGIPTGLPALEPFPVFEPIPIFVP